MYDRACTCRKVNDVRKYLFKLKGRYIEAIPPTSDALLRIPVERGTTQDSTSGNKLRKKLSAETRFSTFAARFVSVVLSVIVDYIVCFSV